MAKDVLDRAKKEHNATVIVDPLLVGEGAGNIDASLQAYLRQPTGDG